MPVKHNLCQDLNRSHDEIQGRRAQDPHLDALIDKYANLDKQVLQAEAEARSDEELKKLKEKRVNLKDEISQRLVAPS